MSRRLPMPTLAYALSIWMALCCMPHAQASDYDCAVLAKFSFDHMVGEKLAALRGIIQRGETHFLVKKNADDSKTILVLTELAEAQFKELNTKTSEIENLAKTKRVPRSVHWLCKTLACASPALVALGALLPHSSQEMGLVKFFAVFWGIAGEIAALAQYSSGMGVIGERTVEVTAPANFKRIQKNLKKLLKSNDQHGPNVIVAALNGSLDQNAARELAKALDVEEYPHAEFARLITQLEDPEPDFILEKSGQRQEKIFGKLIAEREQLVIKSADPDEIMDVAFFIELQAADFMTVKIAKEQFKKRGIMLVYGRNVQGPMDVPLGYAFRNASGSLSLHLWKHLSADKKLEIKNRVASALSLDNDVDPSFVPRAINDTEQWHLFSNRFLRMLPRAAERVRAFPSTDENIASLQAAMDADRQDRGPENAPNRIRE